ncbi:MAG: hypothetical protein JRI52_09005, partial [Deltaproteobacteria bacterium]|nr:hypothetical protein [Deltaproteobacteria bacterium]
LPIQNHADGGRRQAVDRSKGQGARGGMGHGASGKELGVGWVERLFVRWVFRFWIADFGFFGNENFFEESEFSLVIDF